MMPGSCQQQRAAQRAKLYVSLGVGVGQGVAVIAGYATGLEDRLLAVLLVIAATAVSVVTPEVLELKKNKQLTLQGEPMGLYQ